MRWTSLFSRRGQSAAGSKRKPPRARPMLEALEDRDVPTASLYTVNSLADNNTRDTAFTLREAILMSANQLNWSDLSAAEKLQVVSLDNEGPDVIQFAGLAGGVNTISLSASLPVLTHNVNITGPGASRLEIDAAYRGSMLAIDAGATVKLSGLTFTRGGAGGDALVNAGTATIQNCTFGNNRGGAIFNTNTGNLTVEGGSFRANLSASGGAVVNQGTLTVANSLFVANQAQFGGAIYNDQGTLKLTGGTFSKNSLTLDANGNAGAGGAIYNTGTLSADGTTFAENASTYGRGGAITSDNAGNHQGTVSIMRCTFTGNAASHDGGAIWGDAFMGIEQSTFAKNQTVGGAGGAIAGGLNATIFVSNCTLDANRSHGNGGAIMAVGQLRVASSTIDENISDTGRGGGIAIASTSTATMLNSIVAFNNAVSSRDVDGWVTASYSLIFNQTGPTILGSGAGMIFGRDPFLSALADNGGPTQTQSLLSNSVAVNAGDPNNTGDATDQRGMTRVSGGRIDMGAFESQPLVVSSTADTDDGIVSAGNLTLREAIRLSGNLPGRNTITFASDLNGQTLWLNGTPLPTITGNVSIVGPGANVLTIDAGGNSRILQAGSSATAVISDLTLANGYAKGSDGGALLNAGSVSLNRVVLTNDDASVHGGAIANTGAVVVNGCTIAGSDAPTGGALYNTGSATVLNSTFTGSTANVGGGIYNTGTLKVSSSTIARNAAFIAGSEVDNVAGSATFTNSILAGSTVNIADVAGAISASFTLIQDPGTATITGTNTASNILRQDPLLGALGYYGGSTPTLPLLPGSLGIDLGTSTGAPATDARGLPRFGTVDLGAFESQGFALTSATGTSQTAAPGAAFAAPLTISVAALNRVEPVAGGQISFSFTPAANGATAVLASNPASIDNTGVARTAAAANGAVGYYTGVGFARGVTTSQTFSLANDHAPAVLSTGGPYSAGVGGGALNLTASISDADIGQVLAVLWDVNGDGRTDASAILTNTGGPLTATATLTEAQLQALHVFNGASSFPVNVSVTDFVATVPTSAVTKLDIITGGGVPAPSAQLEHVGHAVVGQPFVVAFTHVTDACADDVAGPFRFSFALNKTGLATSFADAGSAQTQSFTFTKPGRYKVYGRVYDHDNAFKDYEIIVTVRAHPLNAESIAHMDTTRDHR